MRNWVEQIFLTLTDLSQIPNSPIQVMNFVFMIVKILSLLL
jgi:hypothetical protein